MADLVAIEARLWSLLAPYRGELEDATIYGMPSLRWPGIKAHDYRRLDDGMAHDLEELLTRLYARYRAAHVEGCPTSRNA